ncbi:MAG: hypothetical protein KJO98_14140 [Rhodothermia bacterium]|nr:hypothetical protein [Rhodothermia bacterium]
MKVDRDTMLRLLRGELDPVSEERAQDAIRRSPDLQSELDQLSRLNAMMSSSAASSFGPYFADRVMKRIAGRATDAKAVLYETMQWVFLRLAAASVLVVIGLGTYNALQGQDLETSASTVEAIFGLPADDLESLYYLQGI